MKHGKLRAPNGRVLRVQSVFHPWLKIGSVVPLEPEGPVAELGLEEHELLRLHLGLARAVRILHNVLARHLNGEDRRVRVRGDAVGAILALARLAILEGLARFTR